MKTEEIAQLIVNALEKRGKLQNLGRSLGNSGAIYIVNDVLKQAISEHEAGKWKKYPENEPTPEINCAVVCKGDKEMDYYIWSLRIKQPGSNRKIWDERIEMFYELPAPYQEGGEG